MINFFIGKPGDGKTMRAVREMLEYLRRKDPRPIVGNIQLFSPQSVEWLVANTPDSAEYWFDRLRTHYFYLEEEKLREFYRYRGGVFLSPESDRPVTSFGKSKGGPPELFPDFSQVKDGVVYFLDEVHVPFGARNWQTNGPQCLYYLSQHRHFGDDIWCITQHPEQVAKEFRMLAQSYIQMRNRYRQKFGKFKMPGGFLENHFSDIPRRGGGMVAFDTHVFPLDPLIAACYDTTAGVGVGAGRAPELVKAKGIPIRLLWLVAVLLIGGLAWSLFSGVGMVMDKTMPTTAAPAPAAEKAPAQSSVQAVGATVLARAVDNDGKETVTVLPLPSGVRLVNGRVTLVLPNGAEISPYDSGYSVSVVGGAAKVNGIAVPLLRGQTQGIRLGSR